MLSEKNKVLLFALVFICVFSGPVFSLAENEASSMGEAPSNTADNGVDAKIEKAWTAYVLRRKNVKSRIAALRVVDLKLPVLLRPAKDRLRPVVEIRLQYLRPGWTLSTMSGEAVERDAFPMQYKIFSYLNAKVNELTLVAKGPSEKKKSATETNGAATSSEALAEQNAADSEKKPEIDSEEEVLYIYAPDSNQYNFESPWNKVLVSAGFTGIGYFQTLYGDYRSSNTTVSVQLAPSDRPENWSYYLNADMTFATLYSTPINRSPQFLSLKGDIAYLVSPQTALSWSTQVLIGGTYLNMFANGSPFGFSNL